MLNASVSVLLDLDTKKCNSLPGELGLTRTGPNLADHILTLFDKTLKIHFVKTFFKGDR